MDIYIVQISFTTNKKSMTTTNGAPKSKFGQIELLQWYYKFLYIWKFLEQIAKTNDLSGQVTDTPVMTWANTRFVLRWSFIKNILSDIFHNPDKKNVFGYITEISSIKWITSIMRELIENDEVFEKFVQKRLKKQFFPFEQIVRFVRNVLNHTLDPNISLKESDFAWQKWFLNDQDKDTIFFKFKYADFFPEWTWNKDYGIDIQVDFSKLWKGNSLFEIINMHQLYLICELCYNLSEVFKYHIISEHKKPKVVEKIVEKPIVKHVPSKKSIRPTNKPATKPMDKPVSTSVIAAKKPYIRNKKSVIQKLPPIHKIPVLQAKPMPPIQKVVENKYLSKVNKSNIPQQKPIHPQATSPKKYITPHKNQIQKPNIPVAKPPVAQEKSDQKKPHMYPVKHYNQKIISYGVKSNKPNTPSVSQAKSPIQWSRPQKLHIPTKK